jgi:hypothetical protein
MDRGDRKDAPDSAGRDLDRPATEPASIEDRYEGWVVRRRRGDMNLKHDLAQHRRFALLFEDLLN